MEKKGLICIVGATDSGKSTTLAAMIEHRSHHDSSHIVTIEDPIEFLHQHADSIVNQREIGMDTNSYSEAIKSALRQAPDVVVIGEIRDHDTMKAALEIVQTGHLVLCTLHATTAYSALERCINFFPPNQHHQVLFDLSMTLKAVISQRLIPNNSNGRSIAVEILLVTALIADLIQQGKIEEIKDIMQRSGAVGMQTFDMALLKLVESGEISYEEALRRADSPNNLRLALMTNPETQNIIPQKNVDSILLGDKPLGLARE